VGAQGVDFLPDAGSSVSNGAVTFATTHWSVVLAAQGASPAADEALEELCRTYWGPVYTYLRLSGTRPEEAEDLTQGFFATLLERKGLNAVRKEKGRLRFYLLGSLKNFLADERRRAIAQKRGNGESLISFDDVRGSRRIVVEQSDRLTADQIFDRRWAVTVLEQVLAELQEEYDSAGKLKLFNEFKKLLMHESDRPSQAEIASEFGMAENAVKQAYHRFRRRYQILLRNEVAQTVPKQTDIEDELRDLIAALRA
jgi:RNA polymerase sigma factor (sigma-70 family)